MSGVVTATNEEVIELDFDRFWKVVNRKFESICGLSLDDVTDFDISEFYPGEKAKKIEYAQAAVDAARSVLENAAGHREASTILGLDQRCMECGRKFDLSNDQDAEEYEYGHDCEAQ
jgi:hypothetical protein